MRPIPADMYVSHVQPAVGWVQNQYLLCAVTHFLQVIKYMWNETLTFDKNCFVLLL